MRKDAGHAAVELGLAVGVLLFPVALVVLSFGPWSERNVAAEALAAEGARAAVLNLDTSSGVSAIEAGAQSLGLDPGLLRIGWCGVSPQPTASGTCPLSRGTVVTVRVEVWTPLINTPWGPVGGLWVAADHSEPIDLYRSLG